MSAAIDPDIAAAFSSQDGDQEAQPKQPTREIDDDIKAAFPERASVRSGVSKSGLIQNIEAMRDTDVEEAKGLGPGAVGAFEALAHYATGKTIGALGAIGSGTPAAEANRKYIENKYTYQPQTEAGKAIVSAGELGSRVINYPGDWVTRKTGVPELGAATNFALQSAPFMVKGAPAVGGLGAAEQSVGAASAADIEALPAPVKERISEIRQGGGSVNQTALEAHREALTQPVPIYLTEGQATGNPSQWTWEFNHRGAEPALQAQANRAVNGLIENLDEYRRQAAPNTVQNDRVQAGQTLLDAYKTYDSQIRQPQIRSAYQALEDANGGQFPADSQAFYKNAVTELTNKRKLRSVPGAVQEILDAHQNGEPMTLNDFEEYRTSLAAEQRKAKRSGDGNALAATNIVRDALENIPLTGEAAQFRSLADKARGLAKTRFDDIRADPAYSAAVDDEDVPIGKASSAADRFVGRYVEGGTKAGLQNMRRHLAGDPIAQEQITASALNKLAESAKTDSGKFNQQSFNDALTNMAPRSSELFGADLADRLGSLGRTARRVIQEPAAAVPNRSGTLIGALGEQAAGKGAAVLEGAVNMKTGGIGGTLIRGAAGKITQGARAQKALRPGAGLESK